MFIPFWDPTPTHPSTPSISNVVFIFVFVFVFLFQGSNGGSFNAGKQSGEGRMRRFFIFVKNNFSIL